MNKWKVIKIDDKYFIRKRTYLIGRQYTYIDSDYDIWKEPRHVLRFCAFSSQDAANKICGALNKI